MQNAGLARTSVTHASLLIGAGPVLVAVIAAAWHHDVARPVAWAGFAVSLGGVALVAGGNGGGATSAGDALVLVSVLIASAMTVAQGRLLEGRDPAALTAVLFLGAAVAALPAAAVTAGLPPAPPAGGAGALAVLAVLGLAAVGTLAPFTLFAYGQRKVSTEVAGAFLNLEPLVGALAGVVAFGDPAGRAARRRRRDPRRHRDEQPPGTARPRPPAPGHGRITATGAPRPNEPAGYFPPVCERKYPRQPERAPRSGPGAAAFVLDTRGGHARAGPARGPRRAPVFDFLWIIRTGARGRGRHRRPVTRRNRTPGVLMSTAPSPAGKLYLVVGYDGSPPAVRALDAAARLLNGRDGRIEVVYVAHLTPAEMMSADAIAEMREVFDEVAVDLQAQAAEQLSGREERWRFERRRGPIHEELVAAAAKVPGAGPDDTGVIVVGSSSQAAHRMIGSVAVSLARHAPVPLVIVP